MSYADIDKGHGTAPALATQQFNLTLRAQYWPQNYPVLH